MVQDFCPRVGLSPDQIKERLRIFCSCIAAVQVPIIHMLRLYKSYLCFQIIFVLSWLQGVDYIKLRIEAQELLQKISTEEERESYDRWYIEYARDGFRFETYEPDSVPKLIQYEQRIRETGNAFDDFVVGVLKGPTKYTQAFSGSRPRAEQKGNWLDRDEDWGRENPDSYEKRIEEFRKAYMEQTTLRKEAESKLNRMVRDRMDSQDRLLGRSIEESSSSITEFSLDDE